MGLSFNFEPTQCRVLLFEKKKLSSFGGSEIWTRAALVNGSDADH